MLPKITTVLLLFGLVYLCESRDLIFRIWGGTPIEIQEAPYVISFQVNGTHYCGGTIVRKDVILTAAHCIVWAASNGTMTIRAGSTSWKTGGTVLGVKDYLVYPSYNGQYDGDVGLLWLDGELNTNTDKIQIVPSLPKANDPDPPTNTMTKVAGWGLTEQNIYPENLRSVDLPIVDHDLCKNQWDKLKNTVITERMICAGYYPQGEHDTCARDSGAGLILGGMLVGVTNFGPKPCGLGTAPGVYANVVKYRQWIDDSIKNHA